MSFAPDNSEAIGKLGAVTGSYHGNARDWKVQHYRTAAGLLHVLLDGHAAEYRDQLKIGLSSAGR